MYEDQGLPIPLRIRIPMSSGFRFAHEPVGNEEGRFCGRQQPLSDLVDRITYSNGGAFLITGYRGIGKTSFVNQVLNRLEQAGTSEPGDASRLISVQINLARSIAPVDLMFLVIRCLYLELDASGILRELDREVARDLKLTYDRTLTSLKLTHLSSNEFTFASPSVEAGPAATRTKLGSIFGYKRSASRGGEVSWLPYEERAAEYDLIRLSRRLLSSWHAPRQFLKRMIPWNRPRMGALRVIFVFDELDKIEDPQELDQLFSLLKNLFTTSGLTFLFVAGKDVQERWGLEAGRGESIYESVFTYEKYLPCLWDGVPSLCGQSLAPPYHHSPDVLVLWKSIAFRGRGIPRRILRTFNEHVRWFHGEPHLALTPYEFRDAEYFAGLEGILAAFRQKIVAPLGAESTPSADDDKRVLGLYYLLDWILRRNSSEFTLAEAITAYEALSPKLVVTGTMAGDIQALVAKLRQRGYVEIASTARNKQFVRANERASERYRLVRAARPDSGKEESPAAPSQLGRYRLMAPLGYGGMGTVSKAVDIETDQIVAVKYTIEQAQAVRSLMRAEANALSNLAHPGIPYFASFDETENTQVLAMELIDGLSLDRLLSGQRRLPQDATVAVALQVAEICSYVHSANFVHGDLKPSNIMVDSTDRIVLIDFSTARHPGAPPSSFGTVGTPAYMAPELLAGQISTSKSDIYAFGVTMYELLSGRLPYESDRHEELLERVKEGPPRLNSSHVAPELESVVFSCMARSPDDRPRSIGSLIVQLRELPHSFQPLREIVNLSRGAKAAESVQNRKRGPTVVEWPPLESQARPVTSRNPTLPGPITRTVQWPPPPSPKAPSWWTRIRSKFRRSSPPPYAILPENGPRCRACGSENSEYANFCRRCGKVLAAKSQSPPPMRSPTIWEFPEASEYVPPNPDLNPNTRRTGTVAPVASMVKARLPDWASVVGDEQAWLEVVSPPDGATHFSMWSERMRIGASEEADVFVDDKALSRLHAEITSAGGKFCIMDLGSLNGTRLNGSPIQAREAIEIHEGDLIQMGNWSARFHLANSASAVPLSSGTV